MDIGWRIKSLNQSPIFRVRAERIKHHLGQKFVNLWWGPRRIKRREKQFVFIEPIWNFYVCTEPVLSAGRDRQRQQGFGYTALRLWLIAKNR